MSSIASKHLAVPADIILYDFRFGPGAFMATEREANDISDFLIDLMEQHGIHAISSFTDTAQPTGSSIGNALEVLEALAVMGYTDFNNWDDRALDCQRDLVIDLFCRLMEETFGSPPKAGWRELAWKKFESGAVLAAWWLVLESHGVSSEVIETLRTYPSRVLLGDGLFLPIRAKTAGRLLHMDQRRLGHIVNFDLAGSDKRSKGSLSRASGLILHKRLNDSVSFDDALCSVYLESDGVCSPDLADQLRICFQLAA